MKDLKLRKFPLLGRYGEKRFLKEIEPMVFKLSGEDLDYMRVIYTEDGKGIYAIDPTGGPMISIDSFIFNNIYVKAIDYNKNINEFLIYTEN